MSDIILALLLGMGLSAACGFRIFIPFAIVSLAVHGGHLSVHESFSWVGSNFALATFLLASAFEVGAYYIPALDHLLDTIASPCAVIAGTIMSAGFLGDMDPTMKWVLAAIIGGGTSTVVQGVTVTARAIVGMATGTLGNPVVSTGEAIGATMMPIAVITLPILALIFVTALGVSLYFLVKLFRRRRAAPPVAMPN